MTADQFSVAVEDVTFAYEADAPVMRFDAQFRKGVITAIMGASGSGKSTLLSLLAGFEMPQSGKIWLAGEDYTHRAPGERPLSMVFQENNLFAHLSVFNNVALGVSPSLKLSASDKESVHHALASVGLENYGKRLPAQLSGGERQRVAVARVLVRHKPILLLDEAFASLGPGLRREMLDLVASLADKNAMTTLMVTHSPEDALHIAQDLVFLGQDGVAFIGPSKELAKSQNQNEAVRNYLIGRGTS
ncbi:thiamine ABC transporter ATP-binding protein [Ahrensia marina]|uniref:Thiamine ABC transporter ATP-binding protein n=1 Tax=Ahrensia marina TaxID=1514904 RepID=A0A0M9GKN4_9HYPH|nr:thiamine ABC transporter ATP-binding protein [Ahrensia marina]KPB00027.1 thiamine ABC transporter ATP-binding protein [Ahrensia marina]